MMGNDLCKRFTPPEPAAHATTERFPLPRWPESANTHRNDDQREHAHLPRKSAPRRGGDPGADSGTNNPHQRAASDM